ncbi:MAG: phenylalanine--tRNA ligase subunit beta [bacterium]
MNILASYNWIKEFLKTDATPDEFARELSLRGPGVEKVISVSGQFKNIVVGKLISVEKHPNADKLRVTQVDVGAKKPQQIVCGGSNLEVGQLVAVALPGSSVRWHGEGEPVLLASAELRGVKSDGMICGANEIGLTDLFPSSGEREILDLTFTKAKPGTLVSTAVGLEDPIFDIEATTNRPDCLSMVGLALEASASGLGRFSFSESGLPKTKKVRDGLKIVIENKKLCSRYLGAVVRGVKVGPSPAWMRARLSQAGIRSINNIVDITNYVMLEIGHPMHAFDRAALEGDLIKIRSAKPGEKMLALDNKEYSLNERDLVIADAVKPIAIAGVIGGEESGTTEKTISVVFEAAAFDPGSVGKTSRSRDLITEASLRFEKGLSSHGCAWAMSRALELVRELMPESELTEIIDVNPKKSPVHVYGFRPAYAESLIGEKIPAQKQKKILESLGFVVSGKGTKWSVKVPFWREFDIEGERDLVEEVARIYGLHNIKPVLPAGFSSRIAQAKNTEFFWIDEMKSFLEATGWTETMTYSYTNAAIYKAIGQSTDTLLAVSNPLSSDFTHLRDKLLPNMLVAIKENQERYPSGKIYEIGNVFMPAQSGLPVEGLRFTAISYGHNEEGFASAKGLLETLADKFGFEGFRLMRMTDNILFHPSRSAEILINGESVGMVGELRAEVQKGADLEHRAGVLTFDFAKLVPNMKLAKIFMGIPTFPSIKRDISFVVQDRLTHDEIMEAFLAVDALVIGAEKFDEYRGPEIGEKRKSLAYHLELRDPNATLTTAQADELLEKVRKVLRDRFAAEVRS